MGSLDGTSISVILIIVSGFMFGVLMILVAVTTGRKRRAKAEASSGGKTTVSSTSAAAKDIGDIPNRSANDLGKYCYDCGEDLGEDALFCPKCGTKRT